MSATRAAFVINKRITFVDTKPELLFDLLAAQYLFNSHRVPEPIDCGSHNLRPDRRVSIGKFSFLVQIDGVYHRTKHQIKKDQWRDRLLNEQGERVLHIDADLLTVKAWWNYIYQQVVRFSMSGEKAKYIYA